MLASLANVHVKNGRYFSQLLVHYEWGGVATSTNLALPLAALNPFLWGNDQPRSETSHGFTTTVFSAAAGYVSKDAIMTLCLFMQMWGRSKELPFA